MASANGGIEPVWSKDGRSLYYRQNDVVYRVPVKTTSTMAVGNPEPIVSGSFENGDFLQPAYDVSEGRRFLMVQSDDSTPEVQLHVVLNWFDELLQRVPGSD